MSKTKKGGNFLNKKFLTQLSSQQKKIIEIYENDIDNAQKLTPNSDNTDYNIENMDNIKHNLKELPQYSALYLKRLEMTKKILIEECKIKWAKIHICKNILDLKGSVSSYHL